MINKTTLKESLSTDIIFSFLEKYGANPIYTKEGIIADTICYNEVGEGSKKLYYYEDIKMFHCYTECEPASFDIYELVIKVLKIQGHRDLSFRDAVIFVANMAGMTVSAFTFRPAAADIAKLYEKIDECEFKEELQIDLKTYDDYLIKNMPCLNILSWNKDNITYGSIKKFNIKYYPPLQQLLIPDYDIDNKLVGIRVRELIDENIETFGKYHPAYISNVIYKFPSGFVLYGLNFNKDNIKKIRRAIIFEGEKSVMAADGYLDKNISVAVFGSTLSTYQIDLLLKLGVEEVIIAFDRQYKEWGDAECLVWTKKIWSLVYKYRKYIKFSMIYDTGHTLQYKDSPTDKGKDAFLKLLEERVTV